MNKGKKEKTASAVLAPAVGAGLKVKRANKSLHWIFTPLRSVKTSELKR